MFKKKFDASTVIIVTICAVLLISWNYIFGPSGLNWMPTSESKNTSEVQKTTEKEKNAEPAKEKPVEQITKNTTEKLAAKEKENVNVKKNSLLKLPEEKDITTKFSDIELNSQESLYTFKINPVKGEISSVTLKKYKNSDKTADVVLNNEIIPGALSISDRTNKWKLINVYKPVVNKEKQSVTLKREFSKADGTEFFVIQKWSLNKSYVINYSVSVINPNSNNLKFKEIDFWAGGIRPIQYLSGDYARSESHRIDALLAKGGIDSVKSSDKELKNDMIQYDPIKWLSVSDKYFACILKPTGKNATFNSGNINHSYTENVKDKDGKETDYTIISAAGRMGNINIEANNKHTWDFEYYVGPKNVTLLKAFAPEATGIMHLAFSFLDTISLWLLYALIFLKGIVGSYGWAIILLTVIVKLIFWPITHKSNVSMRRMQKLQPLIKELREQYKDDKQKLNAKTMELYRKEKVNPLGGCLPILVQIPVFFALYWTLDGAIELRQVSFLWINNLTLPDTIGHIMGVPINPLAIAMALTMVLQQKLTPTATDPAQAKMMMLMPVVMLFFLYNMPSGLTLYWTVSQLISIVQLLFNRYSGKKENLKTA